MITTLEMEQHALRLPEKQRASLAMRILDSLPPRRVATDDGLIEAQRRANELDAGAKMDISQQELDRKIRARSRPQ